MDPREALERIVAALESIAVSLDAIRGERVVRQAILDALVAADESRDCDCGGHCYACLARRALSQL